MKTILKFGLGLLFLCVIATSCNKETSPEDEYTLLNDVPAKVFQSLKSLDENNQPKTFDWTISTNEVWLDSTSTPIDENIIVPIVFPDEFKVLGLKVTISGKKFTNRNRALSSPDIRGGFGYFFEITDIKKLNNKITK